MLSALDQDFKCYFDYQRGVIYIRLMMLGTVPISFSISLMLSTSVPF
jgi:hypothetical protein